MKTVRLAIGLEELGYKIEPNTFDTITIDVGNNNQFLKVELMGR